MDDVKLQTLATSLLTFSDVHSICCKEYVEISGTWSLDPSWINRCSHGFQQNGTPGLEPGREKPAVA